MLQMFIDDTGALNVLEMRAKCRRLKTEQKALDLIVIDYLQLMHGEVVMKVERRRFGNLSWPESPRA